MNHKNKVVACILAHKPEEAARSLWLYRACNKTLILLPSKLTDEMWHQIMQAPGLSYASRQKIEVVGHDIRMTYKGVPRMGVLRREQQSLLQSHMRRGYLGLMSDQDVKGPSTTVYLNSHKLRLRNMYERKLRLLYAELGVPQWVPSMWGKKYNWLEENNPAGARRVDRTGWRVQYSTRLSPAKFLGKIRRLAAASKVGGYRFFCPQYNNSPHNTRAMKGGYRPVYAWSGLFGIFHDSPNYFDPNMSLGADADLQNRIIYERESLGVLTDPCLCVQFGFGVHKYKKGGIHRKPRLNNYREILKRYPGICRLKTMSSKVDQLVYTGCYGKE